MAGRPLLTLALLAAAFAGCRSVAREKKDLAHEYGPRIEANLAAWPAVAERLRTMPPLTEDRIEGARDLVVDALSFAEAPNAALCYAEDLASPDELGYVWARLPATGALNQCASFLHRGHAAFDRAVPTQTLRGLNLQDIRPLYPRCAAYQYLLVIRSIEFLAPSTATEATVPFVPVKETLDLDVPRPEPVPPPPPKKSRKGRVAAPPVEAPAPEPVARLAPTVELGATTERRYLFDGGYLRAEVLAFQLPSAKWLGGFRFTVQNAVRVEGKDDKIRDDFEGRVRQAVIDGLAKCTTDSGKGQQP